MTEEQIKYMVDRFLAWKLPGNFSPDAGISFKPTFNEHTNHPMRHEPSGTNLLDATQAEAMVRHMVDGINSTHSGGIRWNCIFRWTWDIFDQYRRSPKLNIGIAGSRLLIHQTNINRSTNKQSEDVIEVTTGQAYDLLTVISVALGIAVRGFE